MIRRAVTLGVLAAGLGGGAFAQDGPKSVVPWLNDALRGETVEEAAHPAEAPPEAQIVAPVLEDAPPPLQEEEAQGQTPGAQPPGAQLPGVQPPQAAPTGPAAAQETVFAPEPQTPAPPASAEPPAVSVAPISALDADAPGLSRPEEAGLPKDAWRGVSENEALQLLETLGPSSLATANALAVKMLSAAVAPPASFSDGETYLNARLTALSRFGAAANAARIAELADSPRLALARDMALVSGEDGALCGALSQQTDVDAEEALAKIFCLARAGDSGRAALSTQASRALGAADDVTLDLLEAAADPGLAPYVDAPSSSNEMTPIRLAAMRLAKKSPPVDFARRAPLPYLQAALSDAASPRQRLEALERLELAGAASTQDLIDGYRSVRSAESGGVWGRLEAYRNVLRAPDGAFADAVGAALSHAREAGRADTMARVLAPEIAGRAARGALAPSAILRVALRMAGDGRTASTLFPTGAAQSAGPEERLLDRIANPDWNGVWIDADATTLLARAARGDQEAGLLTAALSALEPSLTTAETLYEAPQDLQSALAEGRAAAIAFRALGKLGRGARPTPEDVYGAILSLRALGLEEEARRIAVEAILQDG